MQSDKKATFLKSVMDGGGVKVDEFTCFVIQKSFVNDLIKLGIIKICKFFYNENIISFQNSGF